MWQLVAINAIFIALDITLIALEYSGQYVGEVSVKRAVYTIKLKLEFVLLNQLQAISKIGLTDDNKHSGGAANAAHSHELRSTSLQIGNQASARASSNSAIPGYGPPSSSYRIYKTQEVEIIRESSDRNTTTCDDFVALAPAAAATLKPDGSEKITIVDSDVGISVFKEPSWNSKPPNAKVYA